MRMVEVEIEALKIYVGGSWLCYSSYMLEIDRSFYSLFNS